MALHKPLCRHLRNSNKQRLILAKIYVNNASFIDYESAKFQLNFTKQTIATVTIVMLAQNVKSRSSV